MFRKYFPGMSPVEALKEIHRRSVANRVFLSSFTNLAQHSREQWYFPSFSGAGVLEDIGALVLGTEESLKEDADYLQAYSNLQVPEREAVRKVLEAKEPLEDQTKIAVVKLSIALAKDLKAGLQDQAMTADEALEIYDSSGEVAAFLKEKLEQRKDFDQETMFEKDGYTPTEQGLQAIREELEAIQAASREEEEREERVLTRSQETKRRAYAPQLSPLFGVLENVGNAVLLNHENRNNRPNLQDMHNGKMEIKSNELNIDEIWNTIIRPDKAAFKRVFDYLPNQVVPSQKRHTLLMLSASLALQARIKLKAGLANAKASSQIGEHGPKELSYADPEQGFLHVLDENGGKEYLQPLKGGGQVSVIDVSEERMPEVRARFKEKMAAEGKTDHAMTPTAGAPAVTAKKDNVGGIDLNPNMLDLQIKRDKNGVPLPVFDQPIGQMHINGFLPVIINIQPIQSIPMMLGIATPSKKPANYSELHKMPVDRKVRVTEPDKVLTDA